MCVVAVDEEDEDDQNQSAIFPSSSMTQPVPNVCTYKILVDTYIHTCTYMYLKSRYVCT